MHHLNMYTYTSNMYSAYTANQTSEIQFSLVHDYCCIYARSTTPVKYRKHDSTYKFLKYVFTFTWDIQFGNKYVMPHRVYAKHFSPCMYLKLFHTTVNTIFHDNNDI